MRRRANILGRLRRWQGAVGRYVVASFAVAYLTAGMAPCTAAAAARAGDDASAAARAHADVGHDAHGHDDHGSHGGAAASDPSPAPADHGSQHCPHCPAGTVMAHEEEHASCIARDDVRTAAASHAKDAPQPLATPFGPTPFTLPPPLASPAARPPLPAVHSSPVPLNIRHCVFLI